MKWLDELEDGTEKMMEILFHSGRNRIQPGMLARKLLREMTRKKIISLKKTYVPNKYLLLVAQENEKEFQYVRHSLEKELTDFLKQKALEKGYSLVGIPKVEIASGQNLPTGKVLVIGQWDIAGTADEMWVIDYETGELLLDKPQLTIGRDENCCDICLPSTAVSRKHAFLEKVTGGWIISDLESTNGTFVDGRRIGRELLLGKELVSIGEFNFRLRRVARWRQ